MLPTDVSHGEDISMPSSQSKGSIKHRSYLGGVFTLVFMHGARRRRGCRLAPRGRRGVVGNVASSHVQTQLCTQLGLVDGGQLAMLHHACLLSDVCRLASRPHGCNLRMGAVRSSFGARDILHLKINKQIDTLSETCFLKGSFILVFKFLTRDRTL